MIKNSKHNSLLWSVTLPKEKTKSFLLGTIHIDTSFTQILLKEVRSYILETEVLYTELDFSTMDLEFDSSYFHTSESFILDRYLSPKKYSKLYNSIYKSFKIDINQIKHLKAAFIINLLAEQLFYKMSAKSFDVLLYEYAISNNITTGGIEKVEDQLSVIDVMDDVSHIKQLVAIGKNPRAFSKKIQSLNIAYQRQDIQSLYMKTKNGLGSLKRTMLYDRNSNMSDFISNEIKTKNCFIAIGAGHLSGAYGVLRQLKVAGAIVKPVKLSL